MEAIFDRNFDLYEEQYLEEMEGIEPDYQNPGYTSNRTAFEIDEDDLPF